MQGGLVVPEHDVAHLPVVLVAVLRPGEVGTQALDQGQHKAVFIPAPIGPDTWQLYDLKADPGETVDLAATRPDILARLLRHWDSYVAETGVVEFNFNPLR